MVDILLITAIVLLVAAIPATVLPVVPGTVLTLAGLVVHWLGVGTIGTPLMLSLIGIILLAAVLDTVVGVIAARAGGADWTSAGLGMAVGLVLTAVIGPIGILIGLAGTVFVIERLQGTSSKDCLRASVYTTAATIGSKVTQVLLAVGAAGIVIVLTIL